MNKLEVSKRMEDNKGIWRIKVIVENQVCPHSGGWSTELKTCCHPIRRKGRSFECKSEGCPVKMEIEVERNCGTCGSAFPPFRQSDEGVRVQCMGYWDSGPDGVRKSVLYVCKKWSNPKNHSAGIAPYWCEPLTKRRFTEEELKVKERSRG